MTKTHPKSAPIFDRVTIIGVGLLGASLGLALKQRGMAKHIVGVGRGNSSSLKIALQKGAIDEAQTDPAIGVKDSDLIVLCTPVRQFSEMFSAIAPALKPGALVTDVGSTKQQVMKWAAELLPKTVHFVGSHPMAGSEQRGPEFAKADLYQDAFCFVCSDSPSHATKIEAMWQTLGMRTSLIDAQKHDQWVAAISHLPHAAAFSLVNTAAKFPDALPAVAGGFIDSTRVASSDVHMWTDIFMTNQTAVCHLLDQFIAELTALKTAIAQGDEKTIHQVLTSAKQTRDALMHQRKTAKESKP